MTPVTTIFLHISVALSKVDGSRSFGNLFVRRITIDFAVLYESNYDDVLDATQNTLWKTCCCDRSRRAWSADR